jgi:hypothetical protein
LLQIRRSSAWRGRRWSPLRAAVRARYAVPEAASRPGSSWTWRPRRRRGGRPSVKRRPTTGRWKLPRRRWAASGIRRVQQPPRLHAEKWPSVMDRIQAVESSVSSSNGRLDFDCAITARGSHALTPSEHQIRSSRHVVQDRPGVSTLWADVPDLSTRDRGRPAVWQQCWQQSSASRPLPYQGSFSHQRHLLEPRLAGLSVCPRVTVTVPDGPSDRARSGHAHRSGSRCVHCLHRAELLSCVAVRRLCWAASSCP